MTLLLTTTEAAALLDLEQAMALTVEALREQAAGTVVALPPRHVTVPRGALRIVSGALLGIQRMGVRVGPAAALASDHATALLYDSENGNLLCIMGYSFGTLRTGATMGVATRLLAREDARTVAMIGTGRNALSLLRAACAVRLVERIRVYSRTPERREAFAHQAEAALARPVEAVSEAAAATRGADIVYVATDSRSPALHADWLTPGVFVATMGRPSEIDPSVYLAARRVVVGHKKHEENYYGAAEFPHRLLEVVRAGQLTWDAVPELCDVVVGHAPGRQATDETIVFKESQGGFGDLAFANWVYAQARQRGLGQEWAMD
jgi:alanine dehydrogenase